jgi:hypothetical protein
VQAALDAKASAKAGAFFICGSNPKTRKGELMDKLLFKKALSFVDALRVRFGNMLSTALVYVVYAMAVDQSKNPTDWAQWWDDFDEAKYRYLGTYLEMCQNWVDAKAEEAVAVVSETLAYFDERFATGHHNTEVYLGRDGVYPYLARRAQLWVRRQRGIQVPRVVYLVFNSEHRSLLPKDVAVEYLAQFGLTADTIKDCVFYDTGYSGSIPVKILTLLGVDSVLHNDHIRLTCYVSDPNHVRNIPLVETRKFLKNYGTEKKLRTQLCHLLEDMAKTEKTANRSSPAYRKTGVPRAEAVVEVHQNFYHCILLSAGAIPAVETTFQMEYR